MKKLLLSTIALLSLYAPASWALSNRIFISKHFDKAAAQSKKAFFSWDLDDVFFKTYKPGIYFKTAQRGFPTFARIGTQAITRMFSSKKDLCHYPELRAFKDRKIIKARCKALKGMPADAYKLVLDEYSTGLGDMVIDIANQKSLMPKTVQLLKQLPQHTHHILTNQGTIALNGLIKKFPRFFRQFTVITGVHYTVGVKPIQKPHHAYYLYHLYKVDPQQKGVHIFIDDKKENAKAAAAANACYIGIAFDGNITHLKQDIRDLKKVLGLQIYIS